MDLSLDLTKRKKKKKKVRGPCDLATGWGGGTAPSRAQVRGTLQQQGPSG